MAVADTADMLTAQGRSTTRKQMRKLLVAAACGALIAVAGCGDSSEDATQTAAGQTQTPPTATAGSSPPATPSTVANTPAVDKEADQRIADAAALKLSDLPSGWTASPDDSESETMTCSGYDKLRNQATARGHGLVFSNASENAEVIQNVWLYPDGRAPQQIMDLFDDQEFINCYAAALADSLKEAYEQAGKGVKVNDVKASMLRVADQGDQSAGLRAAIELNVDDTDVDAVMDVSLVRVGRGMELIATYAAFSPMSDTERDRLSAISVDRLSAALTT